MRTVLAKALSLVPLLCVCAFYSSASAAAPPKAGPNGEKLNKCGCYQDEAGACQCTNKKARCVCPGECEPVGCEDKRAKAMEKEAEAELKKQKQREKDEAKLSKSRKNADKGGKTKDEAAAK